MSEEHKFIIGIKVERGAGLNFVLREGVPVPLFSIARIRNQQFNCVTKQWRLVPCQWLGQSG